MLNRELRDLAHVPRWAVLRRQSQQNVATHSWFVAMYCLELMDITGWKGNKNVVGIELIQHALVHDLDEVWTGDIPGPAKRLIVNGHAEEVKAALRERMYKIFPQHFYAYDETDPDIKALVKCADLIDAVFYLCDELQMGNKSVGSTADSGSPLGANFVRLQTAWLNMPWQVEGGYSMSSDEHKARVHQKAATEWVNTMKPALIEAEAGISRILVDPKQ
jgi:5'-deoxynucleotidase